MAERRRTSVSRKQTGSRRPTAPGRGSSIVASRRIIVNIATSADGFIARPDGDVSWLDRPPVRGNYGLGAFVQSIDTILWGRKTFDKALEFGDAAMDFGRNVRHIVFTRRRRAPAERPGVEVVREPVASVAARLRRSRGKHIWMMGGAELIASFLDAGAIDEFMIHVVPVFIGEGIPLIAPRHRSIQLALQSVRRYRDGVVRLHYMVPR
jgi:dihydrofolate reductase